MAKKASFFSSKKFIVMMMLLLMTFSFVIVRQKQELNSNAQTASSGLPWLSGVDTEGVSNDAFGTWRGRPVDIVPIWVPRQSWSDISQPDLWGGLSGAAAGLKLAAGVAMLPEDKSGNWQQCAAGAYDQYFKTAGTNFVKAGRGDVFVRLGWEANGNWFAWSIGNDVANYKACFKREAQALKSTAPNLKIDWNMNKGSSDTSYNIADAYPGDDVVDVVGVDFYDNYPAYPNQAAWDADYMAMNNGGGPSGIGAWLQFAKQHGKKLSVPEWGVNNHNGDPNHGGGADDAFYIQAMFNFFKTNAANIAYESYFNTMNQSFIIDPAGINPTASAKYQELWKAGAGSSAAPAPTTPLAQNIATLQPTYYSLAPCPTCATPVVAQASGGPTYPVSAATPQPQPSFNTPGTNPCSADTSIASDNAKGGHRHHKRHHGGVSNAMFGFMQFLIKLLNMLLQLIGGGQIAVPVTPEPAPAPQPAPMPCAVATVPQSAVPTESIAPTVGLMSPAPTQPATVSQAPAPSGAPANLTFDDEFNGTSLDTSKWEIMDSNKTSGGYGLGGSCFVNDGQHVLVSGGNLILRATQAPGSQCPGGLLDPKNFQSGLIWTHKKFSQTYGHFEMRAKFPDGKGSWPAFWLWGENGLYNNAWTEIDVVEGYDYGSYTDTGATLHEVTGGDTQWCKITPDVSSDYHLYRMDWSANNISIYYDNKLCKTFTNWTPPNGLKNPQPFDQPMYLLLNLAVGMNWGPNGASQTIPDNTNKWPMDMTVDYVRVWK